MRLTRTTALICVFLSFLIGGRGQADPPFSGTIFIDPDIITPSDPTAFETMTASGRGMRRMFDRRVSRWITVNAFLFMVRYDDGLTVEVQVNPEFESVTVARVEAQKYAEVIGRLPTSLRADVETVWIHRGVNPFGGGNNNLLIHTGQGDRYTASGILEETLVHEAAHTSLDANHRNASGWLAAQAADDEFISTYARDFQNREDIAESFLPYLAVRTRSDRISESLANTIIETIPNRIAYFDSLALDMYPITPRQDLAFTSVMYDRSSQTVRLTWNSEWGKTYKIIFSEDILAWRELDAAIPSGGKETHFEFSVRTTKGFFRIKEL